jgi:hypothetical protein
MNRLAMTAIRSSKRRTFLRFGRNGRIALAVALLAGWTTTGAYAYWTTSGQGSASANAGTLERVTIDNVVLGTALRPGGPAVSVTVNLTNPNTFAVDIESLTAGAVASSLAGCSGAGTGVTLNLVGVPGSIPANTTLTYIASASMTTASVSACQGAIFSVPLTLLVRK